MRAPALEPTDMPKPALQSRGALGGPNGRASKRVGTAPVPHHDLLLAFYNTEAAAEHGGGLPDSRLLAAGNSCIKLWSPCSKKLKSEPPQVDASHMHFARDVPEEDENDSAALEMKVLQGPTSGWCSTSSFRTAQRCSSALKTHPLGIGTWAASPTCRVPDHACPCGTWTSATGILASEVPRPHGPPLVV